MKDTARKQNFLIYREAMSTETPTTTQKNCNSHCVLYDSIFLLIVMFILQTENVQQLRSTDIKLSHLALFWIHTSDFLILPCGVASRFCNEAIQTTLLELGFRHNSDILCLHIPPTDCVL